MRSAKAARLLAVLGLALVLTGCGAKASDLPTYRPPVVRPEVTRQQAIAECSTVAADGLSLPEYTGGTVVLVAMSQGHLIYNGEGGRLVTTDAEQARMWNDLNLYRGCARYTTVPAGRYTFEFGHHYVDSAYRGPARSFGRPTSNRYFPRTVTVVLTKQHPNAAVVVDQQPAPVLRGTDGKRGWVYSFDAAGRIVRASPVTHDHSFRVGGLPSGTYRLVAVAPDDSPFAGISAKTEYAERIVTLQPATQDRLPQLLGAPLTPTKPLTTTLRAAIRAYELTYEH